MEKLKHIIERKNFVGKEIEAIQIKSPSKVYRQVLDFDDFIKRKK